MSEFDFTKLKKAVTETVAKCASTFRRHKTTKKAPPPSFTDVLGFAGRLAVSAAGACLMLPFVAAYKAARVAVLAAEISAFAAWEIIKLAPRLIAGLGIMAFAINPFLSSCNKGQETRSGEGDNQVGLSAQTQPVLMPSETPQIVEALKTNGIIDSFDFAKAELTESHKSRLDQLAEAIKIANKDGAYSAVRVIGHADHQTETPEGNQRISDQRADVVASYLKSKGITMTILKEGRSDRNPLVDASGRELAPTMQRAAEVRLMPAVRAVGTAPK